MKICRLIRKKHRVKKSKWNRETGEVERKAGCFFCACYFLTSVGVSEEGSLHILQ